MSTSKRRPPTFARQFNKLAKKVAGHRILPLWAVIEHLGRKSQKPYETPIAVIGSTPEHIYIALPWGRETDWVRNLQAANGGTLKWKGETFALSEPAFVDKAEVLSASPALQRQFTQRWKLDDYLRLDVAAGA